ncbi:MAG: DUF2796 domain-containing protein [bacterium]|nr:DUF2796 domain-containing protein [bacterium]
MATSHRVFALVFALACLISLSACGAEDEPASADATTTPAVEHDDGEHDEGEHGDDEHGDDEASSGLGAHEHGAAEMTVAWIEADVAIDLISPTFNIFGFEYEPATDEDLAVAADRTEALSTPGIIAINAEAGCALADPVATELEYEGSHSEMTASWLFVCEDPDEIRELDTSRLFAEFPSFQDIDAQWISASDQSAAELSPSAPILSLQR